MFGFPECLGQRESHHFGWERSALLDAFQQLKNVDFTASEGLDELNKLRIDKAAFDELKPWET